MDWINFAAILATIAMALVGGPVVLRRMGYTVGKIVFGTLTLLFALLGVCGVIGAVQHKVGLDFLPLPWLVPPMAAYVLVRMRRQA